VRSSKKVKRYPEIKTALPAIPDLNDLSDGEQLLFVSANDARTIDWRLRRLIVVLNNPR
jgi:hypothetical protein